MSKEETIMATMEALRLHDANDTCMTVDECASFLKCHRDTVIRHLHKGTIKGKLLERVWRIPKLQFLKEIVEKESY
ncbi:hypothetical protein C7S20_19275 [Christiangramia fulva]|uniref:Helix-turn-helix domain-containing protein n=1 Tax=Christiangramia fulva TaxID=2126553 RepID=A0A2R3ZAG1_9FLAO|nr:helix-turn-helix domain-containing protein [Christiangramia fulva]AVR47220.1 hypothetical protein C7S20_19275 [Christiangramia fulva]